ncbi:MAG: TetR/AcrR family transcriptional regulator [Solirubrobacterales bacterium]|nr:TetR/AcrR family transcriptional regulator [Solirubrobacterales bacterium]
MNPAPNPDDNNLTPTSGESPSAHRTEVKIQIVDALGAILKRDVRWADVTVDAIAAEAGIKRTLFYNYFSDKGAVLAELGIHVRDALLDISSDWLSSKLSPETLRQDLHRYLEVQIKHAHISQAMRDASPSEGAVRELWESLPRTMIPLTAERIIKARADGIAPPGPDPHLLAFCLILMTARVTFECLFNNPSSLEPVLETAHAVWQLSIYGEAGPSS